jgi:hypothetical protein
MGSFGDYLENAVLNHIFQCGGANLVPAANLFVALSTADPLDTGANIAEPSGGSYARATANASHFAAAANGIVTNDADIAFPACTVAWGTISHFAIFDANVAGNMLAHGSLAVPKAVAAGDTAKFVTGDIVISLT